MSVVVALGLTSGCGDGATGPADAALDLAVPCATGTSMCGAACVDLQNDRAHCGGCDIACASGYACDRGACALSCQAGLTSCGGDDGGAPTCTNLETDRASCGACGKHCGPGFVCAAGACALSCPSSLATCGGVDAVCTNLQTDPQNCGACGQSCQARPGSVCIRGKCAPCADGSCRVVFVSSTTSTGNLGGLAAADARCQSLAGAAGLVGGFRAWLGSSMLSAADRLVHASVPYVRTDGVRVANDWADLTDGFVQATIDHTETGTAAPSTTVVFTGTLRDGSVLAPTCSDWTDGMAATTGRTGVVDDTDDEWTNAALSSCDVAGAIYCFQQ